uniref:non-specific serine/threonine protein kinase n=1 Tax=Arcella intermedia TaxID=1963864 RepID=A0A6B2L4Q6_9EUKA
MSAWNVPSSTNPDYIFDDKESLKKSVSEDYLITEELGMGAFGVVKKAMNIMDQRVVAIKSIRKTDCKPEELVLEVRLQRLFIDFPGVVKIEQVYESVNKINIVMEYISGGELFDAIVENEFYSEADASNLVKQIVNIVEYLHSKNVVHRDLKPENLLFEKKGSKTLKLIDFGIASILDDTHPRLFEVVGSRTYMAPEIHMRTGYGKAVDLYSTGVIMYILLCGYPPFDYEQGIYELAFGSPEWDQISTTAKDIIRLLLDPDPAKRYTATQLKNIQWISGKEVPKDKLDNNIHKTIKNYVDTTKMKARIGGERGGGHRPRVMSIFSLANPNSPETPPFPNVKKPEKKKKSKNKEQELIELLKSEIANHGKGFNKLNEDVHKLQNTTQNPILKDQMDGIGKEIHIMINAFHELQQGITPKLNKAIPKT